MIKSDKAVMCINNLLSNSYRQYVIYKKQEKNLKVHSDLQI